MGMSGNRREIHLFRGMGDRSGRGETTAFIVFTRIAFVAVLALSAIQQIRNFPVVRRPIVL